MNRYMYVLQVQWHAEGMPLKNKTKNHVPQRHCPRYIQISCLRRPEQFYFPIFILSFILCGILFLILAFSFFFWSSVYRVHSMFVCALPRHLHFFIDLVRARAHSTLSAVISIPTALPP